MSDTPEFVPYPVAVAGLGEVTILAPEGVPGYRVALPSGEVQAFPAASGEPSEANAAADLTSALNADPLPARRAELKARLAHRRWEYEVSGGIALAAHPGYTFHSDRDSQFNVLGAVVQNFAGGWKTEQGVFVEMSALDMTALAEACGVRKLTAYGYEATLIGQLDAATTLAELAALAATVEAFAP